MPAAQRGHSLINVKDGISQTEMDRVDESGHPSDLRGVRGAERIGEIARGATETICDLLISGGFRASAASAPPITLEEKQHHQLLLASGANIHEINAVASTSRDQRRAAGSYGMPGARFWR